MAGMPRTPPWLDTTTIRPRPAARIAGSSSWVSRIGPNTLVEKIWADTAAGISSTQPTAATPALWTTASGAPTASRIARAPAVIDAGSSRSSRTVTSRGSSAAAPVAARRRSRAASGERTAATTRHPCRWRWAADASPRPREAPVMTADRSATTVSAAPAVRGRFHVRTARLGARPAGPDAREVRAGLALLLVEAVGVVDLGLGPGVGAGDRRGGLGGPDEGEPRAVADVRDIDDGEHHQERPEGGPAAEHADASGQLLGLGAAGVVPVEEQPGRDHHERDQRRLPDQRELVPLAGGERPERDHLRVDVQLSPHQEDLERGVEHEADGEDQRGQRDQRVPRHERF